MAISVPRPSKVGFCWMKSADLVSSFGKRPAVGKASTIVILCCGGLLVVVANRLGLTLFRERVQ